MAFIDKINQDVPEGRLLIRNGDYVLKDPEAEVSSIPLDKKWERLLKYIKDKTSPLYLFFQCLPFLKNRLHNLYYVNLVILKTDQLRISHFSSADKPRIITKTNKSEFPS